MQDIIRHEQFEMEVLEKLHNSKILDSLVFTGGTMLRLCYGLDRHSVGLDFWILKKIDFSQLFKKIKEVFLAEYNVKDSYNKHFSILFEFTYPKYPRALKIEIRKEIKNIRLEKSIAYSPNSNLQVLVNTVSLKDIMAAKISAFLDRNEIRDVYDMKFMFKKGIKPKIDRNTALLIGNRIAKFTKNDYKVKLGSLLDAEKREYYNKANFQDFKVLFKRTLLTLKVNKG